MKNEKHMTLKSGRYFKMAMVGALMTVISAFAFLGCGIAYTNNLIKKNAELDQIEAEDNITMDEFVEKMLPNMKTSSQLSTALVSSVRVASASLVAGGACAVAGILTEDMDDDRKRKNKGKNKRKIKAKREKKDIAIIEKEAESIL